MVGTRLNVLLVVLYHILCTVTPSTEIYSITENSPFYIVLAILLEWRILRDLRILQIQEVSYASAHDRKWAGGI